MKNLLILLQRLWLIDMNIVLINEFEYLYYKYDQFNTMSINLIMIDQCYLSKTQYIIV